MRLFVHFFVIVFLSVITKNSFSLGAGDNLLAQIRKHVNFGIVPEQADFNVKAIIQSDVNDQKRDTVGYVSDEAGINAAIKKKIKAKFEYLKTKRSYYVGSGETSSKLPSYRLDPVLNILRRTPHPSRRYLKSRKSGKNKAVKLMKDEEISSSSSLEEENWKDAWRHLWMGNKIQALNMTTPKGDTVNMAAARPWGVPCGDPNQHDMPWGTCMLSQECEAEYRIYRGDFTCGRTTFVCCALEISTYDNYQGFDASFASTSLESDTDKSEGGKHEKKKNKNRKDRKRRKHDRLKRKRRIKRLLRKINKEIQKILNRSYRNGTSQRRKKTKVLKKFIKDLKKKYKQDRNSVKQIHETEITKIDDALTNRLNQILGMNLDFAKNSTFRDIIVNGTITPKVARMLMEAYPELTSVLSDKTRRSGGGRGEYLDYDIEYGLLYT